MKKLLIIFIMLITLCSFTSGQINSHDQAIDGQQNTAFAYGSTVRIRADCNMTSLNVTTYSNPTTLYIFNGSASYRNESFVGDIATFTSGIIANEGENWTFFASSGGVLYDTDYTVVTTLPTNGTGSFIEWIAGHSIASGVPTYPFTPNTRFGSISSIDAYSIGSSPTSNSTFNLSLQYPTNGTHYNLDPTSESFYNGSIILNVTNALGKTTCFINDSRWTNQTLDSVSDICYQEQANESTVCGGLDNGTYTFTNTIATTNYIYINYSKPEKATNNSLWQVKIGNTLFENNTLDNSCWNAYDNKIMLRIISFMSAVIPVSSLSEAQCYNSTDWVSIALYGQSGTSITTNTIVDPSLMADGDYSTWAQWSDPSNNWNNLGGTTKGNVIYEEAMFWDIATLDDHVFELTSNISTEGNYSLTYTCTDANESIEEDFWFVIDLTLPNTTISSTGNNWNTNNLTVIGSYLYNLTYNLTFADEYLFQSSVNVSCDINNTIYYWELLDINTSTYNKNDIVSLAGMNPQRCKIYFSASDDHTDEQIPDYFETKINDGLKYETAENIIVEIKSNQKTKKIKSKKIKDRYNFDFDFNDKKLERSFTIKSSQKLYYRSDSKYPAHFVAWNDNTKSGNWIDFLTDEYEKNIYTINKITDYEYEIIIKAKVPTAPKLKAKKKGLFGLFGEEMTQEELIVDSFGLNSFKFKSLGGTNIFNVNYTFYVGGTLNVTGINIYDNSSISDWTATITATDSFPSTNQTETVVGATAYLTNISNGTYNIDFTHPSFFTQNYSVSVTGIIEDFNYSSYQSILNIQAVDVLSGIAQTGLNITLTNGLNITIINTTENITTLYLNATTYDIKINKSGYDQLNASFTTLNKTNHSIIYYLGFLATFNLFDEKTLAPFNMSSPDSMQFLLYCTNQTIQYEVTTNVSILPIGCQFDKYKFVLNYGLTSYYRTFITDYDSIINNSIYLIDLGTTQSIFNTFIVDDLFQDYEDVSIYVLKTINSADALITADFVDVENKIGAFLIENNEYKLEIHSSNKPIRLLGTYNSDIAGDKNLRLYDISLEPETSGLNNDVIYAQGVQNISGDLYTVATFEDRGSATSTVTYTVWENTYGSVPIYQLSTLYNDTAIEFMYNASPYENSTLISQLSIQYLGSYHNSTKTVSAGDQRLRLDPVTDGHLSMNFLNWFFTILLGVFAIMATIKTANKVSLAMIGLASLFVLFGWYGLSWSILVLSLMISIFSIMKEGDQNMSRL